MGEASIILVEMRYEMRDEWFNVPAIMTVRLGVEGRRVGPVKLVIEPTVYYDYISL